jgi:hypothetical protein
VAKAWAVQSRAKRLTGKGGRHVWNIAFRLRRGEKSQVKRNKETWHKRVRPRLWVHVALAKRIDLEKRKRSAINLRIAGSHLYKEQGI